MAKCQCWMPKSKQVLSLCISNSYFEAKSGPLPYWKLSNVADWCKKATLYENAPRFLSAALRETLSLKPRSISAVSATPRTLPEMQAYILPRRKN